MILAPAVRKTLRDGSTGCLVWHESQRPGQSRTDHRCGCRGRFVDLRRIADPAKYQRHSLRRRPNRTRTLCKLVPLGGCRSRSLPDCGQRVARLFITLGNAESAVHRSLHGFCFLLTECVSKMAREIARPATVDGVGACHHEPCVRAGGQSLLEDRGYMFGEEFRHYVEDDLMKRTPYPDAKPMGAFPIGQRSE